MFLDAPTFIINLDRAPERRAHAMSAVEAAGFTNITRWRGVDALHDDMHAAWAAHGNPKKDIMDPEFVMYAGRQGCALSHYGIWKHVAENNIPMAHVFEDDVVFHPSWASLHKTYYDMTPKDFDILYLGSKHSDHSDAHVQKEPVYCTHAYTITNTGARKLYGLLMNDPRGVSTIDNHIRKFMVAALKGASPRQPTLNWYVWNATTHLCEEMKMPGDFRWRNMGLVFQDYVLPSYIQATY